MVNNADRAPIGGEKADLATALARLNSRVTQVLGEELDSVLEQFVGSVTPRPVEGARGIRIPLARRSWDLLCEALTYVVEKPHLDDLEESREKLGDILRYIKHKLE